MIWVQAILPLVLGLLVVGPWQNVQADKFFNLRAKNNTYGRPGNKTHNSKAVENSLYMKYACQGKVDGMRLPIEESCTQYWECKQGLAKLMTCKNGKHFSTTGLACIDERLSKCSIKCEGLCCDKQDGLHADPTNCGNFIICVNKEAHVMSCGSVFKFNAENLMCDVPERARCTEKTNNNNTFIERKIEAKPIISKPKMYMISHQICRNKFNGQTVGIAGSCNKFYLCVNGKGHLKSCGNLQFNAEKHYCDTKTSTYCSKFEEEDVILNEDEHPLVEGIPRPWLRPTFPVPNIPVAEGSKPQQKPEAPEKPKGNGWNFWKPKPVAPQNVDDLQPPHRVPGIPLPSDNQSNAGNLLYPPVVGQEKPPKPHLPEGYEKPETLPYHPPNQGLQTAPKPPVINHIPVPPNVVDPDVEELINPKDYGYLCEDQSVGALVAVPKHCNKYIRCKWDWYERRVAEVESCPKNKHFNAKSKLCDKPEKAGCVFHLNKKDF